MTPSTKPGTAGGTAKAGHGRATACGLPRLSSGGRRLHLLRLILIGAAQAGAAVALALATRDALDAVFAPGPAIATPSELRTFVLLAAAAAASIWLRWYGHVEAERLGQSYVHVVRMVLFRHLLAVGADALRARASGALALRFVGDLTALRNWVSLGVARLVVSGVALTLTLMALALVEPVVAAALGLALAPAGVIAYLLGHPLAERTRRLRDRRGSFAGLLQDRVAGLAVIEAFGQEQRETSRIRRKSRDVRAAALRRALSIATMRAVGEAGAMMSAIVALIASMGIAGTVDAGPGAVAAAIMLAGLLGPRAQELVRVWEFRTAAVVAYAKLGQLMAVEPVGRLAEPQRRMTLKAKPGEPLALEIRAVSQPPCLARIDLDLAAASRVVVSGPSGSGKSTLLRIAAGLMVPASGTVRLGGVEASRLPPAERARRVALVSPDLPLLRGSLRLNLGYGASQPDAALEAMLVALGLGALLERLGGLDARLAERGAGLSSGERARLALARALLVRPGLLLLDEADIHLDPTSRVRFDAALAAFPGTVLTSTHDPARTAGADAAWRLEAGRLVPLAPAAPVRAVS